MLDCIYVVYNRHITVDGLGVLEPVVWSDLTRVCCLHLCIPNLVHSSAVLVSVGESYLCCPRVHGGVAVHTLQVAYHSTAIL